MLLLPFVSPYSNSDLRDTISRHIGLFLNTFVENHDVKIYELNKVKFGTLLSQRLVIRYDGEHQ